MISNAKKRIIEVIYEKIMTKGEYPDFGVPTLKCSECMFHEIVCYPPTICKGCFQGWKEEEEQ